MSKVQFVDKSHALKWILEDDRYDSKDPFVSYSSLKMYRDGEIPYPKNAYTPWFDLGTETHAQWLENKSVKRLSKTDKLVLKAMLKALRGNKMAMQLLKGSEVEQEFEEVIHGMNCCGRIDILNKVYGYIADLKTTNLTTRKAFIQAMDFLQVAMYQAATGLKDFYYIGVSKQYPHDVFIFNAMDYPDRVREAKAQLKKYLKLVKVDLKKMIAKNEYNNRHKGATKNRIVQKGNKNKIGCGGLHDKKVKRNLPYRKKIVSRLIRHTNKRKR